VLCVVFHGGLDGHFAHGKILKMDFVNVTKPYLVSALFYYNSQLYAILDTPETYSGVTTPIPARVVKVPASGEVKEGIDLPTPCPGQKCSSQTLSIDVQGSILYVLLTSVNPRGARVFASVNLDALKLVGSEPFNDPNNYLDLLIPYSEERQLFGISNSKAYAGISQFNLPALNTSLRGLPSVPADITTGFVLPSTQSLYLANMNVYQLSLPSLTLTNTFKVWPYYFTRIHAFKEDALLVAISVNTQSGGCFLHIFDVLAGGFRERGYQMNAACTSGLLVDSLNPTTRGSNIFVASGNQVTQATFDYLTQPHAIDSKTLPYIYDFYTPFGGGKSYSLDEKQKLFAFPLIYFAGVNIGTVGAVGIFSYE